MSNTLHLEFDQFIKNNHPNLIFRPQQKEVILDMIDAYFENPNGIYLLDAPTGSGKSLIAMMFSDFLVHKKNKGYILASDLVLHQQYVNDFRRMKLWNWGDVKGIDNYLCIVNNEPFSIGDCKNKGISYKEAEQLSCFKQCKYLMSRRKAIRSPISLLTYPYALIQRNFVENKQDIPPFPKRDFVVCDEAHKLLDIVQSHFSPIVSHDIYKKIDKLLDTLFEIGVSVPKISSVRLEKAIHKIDKENNNKILLEQLKIVTKELSKLISIVGDLREQASDYFIDEKVPKDWIIAFNLYDWCKDVHCKLEDYCEIIDKVGIQKMVKNPNDKNIIFNCIDEYYLLDKHFYNKFGFKLLMTATMGKPADFMKNHGISKAKYFKMSSHFNWEKSPIIYYPGRRLSERFIDDNFDWSIEKLLDILSMHTGESGIIHTASYDRAKKIHQALPKMIKSKVLLYKGSEEKTKVLKKMKKKPGLIIMGPSLLEGLNLIDDLSRFQIFMKVPYPHLGDKYVAAKLQHSQDWYNWKTSVNVLQGVGRSIRSETDWAITYLLDGGFGDLFRNAGSQFPIEFRNRIQIERK